VKKHGKDWILVAAMISGRTNPLCRQRWVNTVDPANKTLKGKWTPEEDAKLTEEVKKHGKDWLAVANMVPGRSNLQCRRRWINTVDPTNKKNKGKARISWTPEEDAKLIEAAKKHGTDWVAVAALVHGRSNQQCRERWVKTLDPDRASNPVDEELDAGVDEALDSVLT
jgi:myb proto-oncogene protein